MKVSVRSSDQGDSLETAAQIGNARREKEGVARAADRVTRDVDPSEVADLLERPPRASLTFRRDDAVQIEAVALRMVDGQPCCGLTREASAALVGADEVVLLADDGWYWFQLRGISLRGRLTPMTRPPAGGSPALRWFRLAPRRTLAWDYGTIHDEPSGPASDENVRAFLAGSMVVQVAALSAKGNAFVTPLWFVADAGKLYITTGTQSRAGRNVVSNPAVTLLFTGERLGPCAGALRMTATAICRDGLPPARVLARIAWKYYVHPRALVSELRNVARWRLRLRYYGGLSPGYLEVTPSSTEYVRRES